ncbi:hypothetical protein K458DRAFT_381227 [Lentithecium fluviatile CBS 122367]|uniref:Uncharacterized protein n=1 Tax=Lentithecium fluviatile CBS 122367 TaxID=1168545 RepID=A0A6G1ICA4_9PLEO|nr:hypothetical protein K458DRAFT_381227 [Lentithecium fluviatile CBS 122367]
MLQNLALLFLATAGLTAAAPPKNLPACSIVDRRCKCPAGSTFKNLTSFGIIGAPAIEVQKIMGPFLNIEFQGGLIPASETGKEGKPGASRTFHFNGPEGPYNITEVLMEFKAFKDGSFAQIYQQALKPASVHIPGGGTYHGNWVVIKGQQTLIANETVVAWRNWRCEEGETFPAALSHEGGIANASAIIAKAGKRTGVDVTPFTIFYEVRDD